MRTLIAASFSLVISALAAHALDEKKLVGQIVLLGKGK
jgi:hypothetical protein